MMLTPSLVQTSRRILRRCFSEAIPTPTTAIINRNIEISANDRDSHNLFDLSIESASEDALLEAFSFLSAALLEAFSCPSTVTPTMQVRFQRVGCRPSGANIGRHGKRPSHTLTNTPIEYSFFSTGSSSLPPHLTSEHQIEDEYAVPGGAM
jgi:hypothetical protein